MKKLPAINVPDAISAILANDGTINESILTPVFDPIEDQQLTLPPSKAKKLGKKRKNTTRKQGIAANLESPTKRRRISEKSNEMEAVSLITSEARTPVLKSKKGCKASRKQIKKNTLEKIDS
jgi:hypothetical protein